MKQNVVEPKSSQGASIIRSVSVDRTIHPMELLSRTRIPNLHFGDPRIMDSLLSSRGVTSEIDITFFELPMECFRSLDSEGLLFEFRRRALKPADPCAVIQLNIDDPSFMDTHRHCAIWTSVGGRENLLLPSELIPGYADLCHIFFVRYGIPHAYGGEALGDKHIGLYRGLPGGRRSGPVWMAGVHAGWY